MIDRYRHTQVGWTLIVILSLVLLVGLPPLYLANLTIAWIAFATIISSSLAVFATMTVSVDDRAVSFFMGLGLVRQRYPLEDIRTYRVVKNPWYYGFGIKLFPGGMLHNVSGRDAVELVLSNGKLRRIGTDEPEALERALERALGRPEPLTEQEAAQQGRARRRSILVIVGIVVALVGGIALLMHFQMRPPTVTITRDSLSVQGLIYGEDIPLRDIRTLSLEPRLPKIRIRTNGFAWSGTLRGNFRMDQLGDGKLFIEHRSPPYVLVRTRDSYVIFNFEDAEKTRLLFAALAEARQAFER